jgi:hypothetical protein
MLRIKQRFLQRMDSALLRIHLLLFEEVLLRFVVLMSTSLFDIGGRSSYCHGLCVTETPFLF